MRRSVYTVAGVLSLALIGSAIATAAATANPSPSGPGHRALDAVNSGAVSVHRGQHGLVNYVSARPGHPLAAPSGMSARTASDAVKVARANVNDFAPMFGIANPSSDLAQVSTSSVGKVRLVRYQQTHNGVPVIGGQLVVSQNSSGALQAINGSAGAVAGVTTTAKVSAASAASVAIRSTARSAKAAAGSLVASKPKLSIYDPSLLGAPAPLGPRAVYQVTVTSPKNAAVNQYVLVDANVGAVALSFSQIDSIRPGGTQPATFTPKSKAPAVALADDPTPGNPARQICDFGDVKYANGDETCPGNQPAISDPANSSIADVRAAYDLTGRVSDFYHALGRAGIDDNDMQLTSTTDFCYPTAYGIPCPLENAFWDGYQMVFGRGYASADDVVGHELTHGVTQNTSNLLYYYQAGSINESISDVMGELFDQWNSDDTVVPGTDGPSATWLIGEDLPGGAIRSMSNPPSYHQPGAVNSSLWSNDPTDSGGVHADSGPGNHAAYLAAMGGTYNSVTIPGIQDGNMIMKIAGIWLGADQLLTSGASYADLANALNQSCINQESATIADTITTPADCTSVADAVIATRMTSAPVVGTPVTQAVQCGSGYIVNNEFTDNFNRPANGSLGSTWTQTTSSAVPDPYISNEATPGSTDKSGASGNAALIPDWYDEAPSTRYIYTKNYTKLSSAHTNYLYFQHLDSFDWAPAGTYDGQTATEYYDGGFVQIDVDGDGKSWISLPSTTTWVNGPNHKIYKVSSSGTLTGTQTGFGGDSRVWTASRATLPSTLKGKSVRLRFQVTTDGYDSATSAYGWWLDNVSLSDCVKAPAAPTSVVYSGYHKSAKVSWTGSSTNGGSAIKAYAVYIKAAGATSYTRTTLPATARSYTWTGLSNGVDYTFEIRAENSDGLYSPFVPTSGGYKLAGASLKLSASATTVPTGSSVTLTGTLTATTAKTPLTTRTINLYSRKHGSSTYTESTLTAVTNSSGQFTFTVKPPAAEDYYVQYSTGSHTSMGTASSSVTVSLS